VAFFGQLAQSICFCGHLAHFPSVTAGSVGAEVAVTALVPTDTAMATTKRKMMTTLFMNTPLPDIFSF
jgi:5-methylthioribose kinase